MIELGIWNCNCLKTACTGPSIGVVIVVIAITCTYLILERKKLSNIKQKYFQQHGGMMLLQEISLKQGTGFSIFTEAELIEATDKFDDKNILGRGGHGTVYKGLLKDGSLIAVKRCVSMTSEQQKKEFGKEMLILSQINHKNIVKLLGCCLEVEVPMLVYEFIPNGTLFQFIHGDNGSRSIPFSTRIRIALESALALAYLHSWASPPILHGDVKSSNILLDENYEAKVSDFGASILAPADKSQFMTLVQGTCGYLDPEYMQTCQLTDKSDVYSFGVVLLELLTGSTACNLEGPENERSLSLRFLNAMKEDRLVDIIDSRIKADGSDNGLLEEVAELARQCLDMIGERRPAMRDVAEKLDQLTKVMQQQHPWVPAQHNPEEVESLLGESSVASLEMISTGNFSMEKRIVHGLLDSGR
jgi:serine/threonine protein kinase